jgi:hypothetical protein
MFLATFGLALNLLLWGVPGMLAAGASAHELMPDLTPTLAQALTPIARERSSNETLPDALMQLVGAESEALQVAGLGLQQPTPPDLAHRATDAGHHVEQATETYIRAAQAILNH